MLFDRDGAGHDYEQVHVVQDKPSGLRALIAIHSTRLGPAAGGIRRWRYASEDAALADALRLAEGMTLKCALAGLDAGGGKTVIMDHAGLKKIDAYAALGRAIDALGGSYHSGPDVGTGHDELEAVRAHTRHVNRSDNDANASTARGVMAGIRGLMRALEGEPDLAGRRFVVQGLGGVGMSVARRLHERGGIVLATDVRQAAIDAALKHGLGVIAPEDALREPCDVFVPCALGRILTAESAAALPARGVCGSANNQLGDAQAARVLAERDVLLAPDFVVNSGAVIEGVLTAQQGASDAVREQARKRIDAIEGTVEKLLLEARARNAAPDVVAREWARARLTA